MAPAMALYLADGAGEPRYFLPSPQSQPALILFLLSKPSQVFSPRLGSLPGFFAGSKKNSRSLILTVSPV